MMPVGPILLLILVVLLTTGFLGGVLNRLRMSRTSAAVLAIAALFGGLAEVRVAPGLALNLGAVLLPAGLAFYLLLTAGSALDAIWTLAAAAMTGGAVYAVGHWFPPGQPTELNLFLLDAQYVYALAAGLAGFLTGRSERSSAAAAILGILLADAAHYVADPLLGQPVAGVLRLGGGGFYGSAVVAGAIAVTLAYWLNDRPTVAMADR